MQVSVEAKEGLERVLKVQVPQNRVEKAVGDRLREVAKTADLKGFQKFKAGDDKIMQTRLKEVTRRYKDGIHQEVCQDIIRETLFEAIEQEKLKPAGMPKIESTKTDIGQDLEYEAIVELMPEVTLKPVSGAKVETINAEVTDGDITKALDGLRKQSAEWAEVDRKAANGDRVTIDFVGFIDKEKFDGGSSEDFPLELGSGSMIAGFEDGIVGAKPNAGLKLKLKFPEEYHHKDYAGKKVVFEVTVKKIEEPKLPELNDEFVEKFKVEGGVDGMRAEIRKNMERDLSGQLKALIKQSVMNAFMDKNSVDVPESLVQQEQAQLQQQMLSQFKENPDMANLPQIPQDMFVAKAKRRVLLGLLFNQYITDFDVKANAEEVRKKVEEFGQVYDNPEEFVKWYYSDEKRVEDANALVVEEKIFDSLLADMKVSEKSMSYDDVMKISLED